MARLEDFRALNFFNQESFRALKLSNLANFMMTFVNVFQVAQIVFE